VVAQSSVLETGASVSERKLLTNLS